MLSARSELDDRLAGLSLGVDDYLGKPFEPQELLFRIGNILRRAGAAPAGSKALGAVDFGPFRFELEEGTLTRDETPVRITDRERDILTALATAPDGAVSRQTLFELHDGVNDRTVDVHINRLRRKIEENPADPVYLQTVRGIGYRLRINR